MSNDANTNIDTIMEYVPSGKNYAKFPYVKSSERKRRFVYHRIDHNGVKKLGSRNRTLCTHDSTSSFLNPILTMLCYIIFGCHIDTTRW